MKLFLGEDPVGDHEVLDKTSAEAVEADGSQPLLCFQGKRHYRTSREAIKAKPAPHIRARISRTIALPAMHGDGTVRGDLFSGRRARGDHGATDRGRPSCRNGGPRRSGPAAAGW
jgi:hypothetical protein